LPLPHPLLVAVFDGLLALYFFFYACRRSFLGTHVQHSVPRSSPGRPRLRLAPAATAAPPAPLQFWTAAPKPAEPAAAEQPEQAGSKFDWFDQVNYGGCEPSLDG
jgi:hypothetical protein